jgi:UDP-N-acetylmuramoylalanine--D-glutamate ligase
MVSAINSFSDQDIVLVAGGKNKGISYAGAAGVVSKNVNSVVLFGENKFQVSKDLESSSKCHTAKDIDEAVRTAVGLTDGSGVVLFSPGTSSFDMFKGYEDRGKAFKNSVTKLIT